MTKHLLASLLAVLAVVALVAPAPLISAQTEVEPGACDAGGACDGCSTCKEYVDGGYSCTGCPRTAASVQFTDDRTARISIPVDQQFLEEWGLEAAPARLSLSPVPGIFSVDSSRMVASRVDGAVGQTAIFEVTLAPGVTQDQALRGLRSAAFFTAESRNEVGEVLIPAENLLSEESLGLVARDQ